MPGSARRILLAVLATALLAAGCGRGADEAATTTPCDDAAFRAQDEELYVSQATVGNAIAGGAEPATLLLDLRRARQALAGYLDAHPQCDEVLRRVEATEREAISALDDAIAALENDGEAASHLTRARDALVLAQARLSASP